MNKTTYYDLNLVEGTDIVNPLTVDNPNYETIDEALHDNAVAGVTLASEIANANIHALTRANSECAVIRFIATSNWKAGDTVTVDGVPVTATLPSGESLPNGAYVINANVLCILTGTNLTVFAERENVKDSSEISYGNTTVKTELDNINTELDRKWKALWTNDDINNPFEAQTVTMDLEGYTLFAVEYTTNKGVSRGKIAFVRLGKRIPMDSVYANGNNVYLRTRDCAIYSTGVIFKEGYFNTTLDNDVCIPIGVYGVL